MGVGNSACFVLTEVSPRHYTGQAGHKKGSGCEQPSDWKLALFVLRKCHNWKTIELSPECVSSAAECSVGPGMRTSQHHSVLINKALGELP